MRIVITGITGLRNRGVEALLATTVAGVRRRWPDGEVHVLTYDQPFDACRGWDVTFHANLFRDPSANVWRAMARKLHPRRRRDARRMQDLISQASVVIASGGDVFSSDYGGLARHLAPLDMAVKCRVPVFFLGHSIGRFRTTADTQRWLRTARHSLGITVRESASYQYVVEELGLKSMPVERSADVAFLLEPVALDRVRALRRHYAIDDSQSCVACCVSQGITRYASQDEERHVEAWSELIRHITGDQRRQVLIVPHVQERYIHNDDRLLATRLLRQLDYPPNVRLAAADHTAAEYKGLIASCDFVVAERMHAAIAGFSTAVPTLAVGYSIKSEGIVGDLYGTAEDVQQVLLPFERFLEPGQAVAVFDGAWARRAELADRLAQRVPDAKAAAEKNFEVLGKLLDSS